MIWKFTQVFQNMITFINLQQYAHIKIYNFMETDFTAALFCSARNWSAASSKTEIE